MTAAPLLFKQLADLTAMRDIELMEFSLLKTLNGLLKPNGLRILKMDMKEQVFSNVSFNNRECQVGSENIVLPEGILPAIGDSIASGGGDRTVRIGDELHAIYPIHKTRTFQVFLIVTTSSCLSGLNSYLVTGMLQIYRNFCEVLREGQTDQLTGLFNRKTFDECINKVFMLIPQADDHFPADRRKYDTVSYWLVMVDIDHFKAVNDKLGHLFGDEVLVILSQMMMSTFRGEDMIFRFGGEEFVLILRCPSREDCSLALERFRVAVESRIFPQTGNITISLGACQMLRETFSTTLIDYADKALYHSKHNGRNRLTFFEDLVASGLEAEENILPGAITFF